jgi:hypothetical protein
MVKNDAQFLYIALDLVVDNGQDLGTGDYFWLSVDNDAEKNLRSYVLQAYYGENLAALIAMDSYANHQSDSRQWQGITNTLIPSTKWVPPRTCAYQFRLSATPKVTNGYSYIGYTETTRHITIIKPGTSTPITPKFSTDLPLGLVASDRPTAQGEEPTKLGKDTFAP